MLNKNFYVQLIIEILKTLLTEFSTGLTLFILKAYISMNTVKIAVFSPILLLLLF